LQNERSDYSNLSVIIMKTDIKEIIYLLLVRIPTTIWGKYIKHNLVRMHWGRGLNNFGDCLQPYIARHYGLTPVYVPSQQKADIILQGSILQLIPESYSGYILGTGGDKKDYDFPNARIVGVRGKLTKRCFKRNENLILGDTGLLTKHVFPEVVKRIYDLGIVFHFVDENSELAHNYRDRFSCNNVLFINVLDNPRKVVHLIKQCKHIISSSLHGLVIADAFAIPNVRIVNRGTMPTKFYDFKFEDYYSALNEEPTCIEINGSESFSDLIQCTTVKNQTIISQIIHNLDQAMTALAAYYNCRLKLRLQNADNKHDISKTGGVISFYNDYLYSVRA